jgi:hypothetical protein
VHPNLLLADLSLDTLFSTAWMHTLWGVKEVEQRHLRMIWRQSSCRGGAKDKSAGSGFDANPKGKTHGWVLQSISPSDAKTRLKKPSR